MCRFGTLILCLICLLVIIFTWSKGISCRSKYWIIPCIKNNNYLIWCKYYLTFDYNRGKLFTCKILNQIRGRPFYMILAMICKTTYDEPVNTEHCLSGIEFHSSCRIQHLDYCIFVYSLWLSQIVTDRLDPVARSRLGLFQPVMERSIRIHSSWLRLT